MAVNTMSKLKKITSKSKQIKEKDICVCGHPKFMHHSYVFSDRIGHCMVHGCRPNDNTPNGCKRFRKKGGDGAHSSHD